MTEDRDPLEIKIDEFADKLIDAAGKNDVEGKPLFSPPQLVNTLEALTKWYDAKRKRDGGSGWGSGLKGETNE